MEQGNDRASILALIPYYRPGFKGGGPIASLEALVGQLGDEFSWTIATSDRDYGESASYPDIPKNGPLVKDGLSIFYLKPGLGRLFRLAKLLGDDYDLIYLNDMFSPLWGVWPLVLRLIRWLKRKSVLVAPRNQFSSGALGIKRIKKRLFLWTAQRVGLWRGLLWHATCRNEQEEIRRYAGAAARIWIAPEFPNVNVLSREAGTLLPSPGSLRIILLSRISPMKNLEYALSVLERLPFSVQFDVVGPAENDAYLAEMKALMTELPAHVTATYLGPVEPQQVQQLLGSYHAMFLPTRGENFGHVILEALTAGCPPIISDRTPWKDLKESGCGWVLPLEDEEGFRKAMMELNAMAHEDRARMRTAARQYARAYIENPEIKESNLKMFWEVLEQ